jgi:osmotically-inducible protein OsmY
MTVRLPSHARRTKALGLAAAVALAPAAAATAQPQSPDTDTAETASAAPGRPAAPEEGASKVSAEALERKLERRLGLDRDQLGVVRSGGQVRVSGLVEERGLARRITRMLEERFGVAKVSNSATWVEDLPAGYSRRAGDS